ncbi:disease resistance protein RPV1-like [Rhodamnia argentea]|uniref:Disease resistance protein RPV1-like n=1 Tax=Rhodamnia argentea TaxID=178133 RepID=A0ABM3HBT8_9MYRT|nr:disease resistance protein RPV1-like [Rhodamnia argentea]
MDVNNAFLQGTLEEEVYMMQPPGYGDPTKPNHVCKLRKAIYGLGQAPRAWYNELSAFLLDHSFVNSKVDSSLFIYSKNGKYMYFLVYVDDLIITGSDSKVVNQFIALLSHRFSGKDLGSLHYFLGVEVVPTRHGILLSQHKYIWDLLERHKMTAAKEVSTPMATGTSLTIHGGIELTNPTDFRSLIGGLQYLLITRPDIAYTVNKLSQFMHKPNDTHWTAAKRLLRYLKSTIFHGLHLRRDTTPTLHAYSDADWAGNSDDRTSTSGFIIYIGANPISWSSRKQKSIARSSTEAEYRAIATTSAEILWVQNLLQELAIHSTQPPIIHCDNIGATYVCANPVFHSRMKHIAIDYHFVRELVQTHRLQLAGSNFLFVLAFLIVSIVRHEGQLVKHVVTKVLSELKEAYLVVTDSLVGVDHSVKEILEMIGTNMDDVKIVRIHGMGGIGKTTLAKVVYNKLSRNFARCCYLDDVRENSNSKGIVYLQNRLISNLSRQAHPPVDCVDEGIRMIEERFSSLEALILLDDVDENSQLIALLGRRCCFGPGTLILITTRNEIVLHKFDVKLIYPVGEMDSKRSLQPFSKHAFGRDHPPLEKLEQSREIVKIAQGLPLVLEVMGSSLCAQKEIIWKEYQEKWKKGRIEAIQSKLMISYEALDPCQQQIFLDIACLFIGYDKNMVMYMWGDGELCPTHSLEVLQLMSLIKIEKDNKFWMHDHLKYLGRKIASQESGGRSARNKEALDVLQGKKRNEKLEALSLEFEEVLEYHFPLEGFADLRNLKLLEVDSSSPRHESVERLMTPDLSELLTLERLILDYCDELAEIDSSIGELKNLVFLSLMGCRELRHLPEELGGLPSLTVLLLDGTCVGEISGSVNLPTSLSKLSLANTAITHLPHAIGEMASLELLSLYGSLFINRLPYFIGQLQSLTKLDLSFSTITELPDSMERLENLQVLRIWQCYSSEGISAMPKLPVSLTSLAIWSESLVALPDLSNLINLKQLVLLMGGPSESEQVPMPWWLGRLYKLQVLALKIPHMTNLSPDLSALSHLKFLYLEDCESLQCIPQISSTVSELHILDCQSLTTLDISNLKNLSELYIVGTPVEDLSGRELLDNLLECKIEKIGHSGASAHSCNNLFQMVFDGL